MTDVGTYEDRELFRRIARGDEDAFRHIFEQYRGLLFAFAMKMTGSTVIAEEVLQEVFIKCWTSRTELAGIDVPRNYLFVITRNRILDHLRKIAADQRLLNQLWIIRSPEGDSADNAIGLKESSSLVEKALSTITEQKQLIFRLSRYEGLSNGEIAEKLGLSKSRVKNVLVETTKFLRQTLLHHIEPILLLLFFRLF